jgi:hypothetical protein
MMTVTARIPMITINTAIIPLLPRSWEGEGVTFFFMLFVPFAGVSILCQIEG